MKKKIKALIDQQPDAVCSDCGQQYGNWFQGSYSGPSAHVASYYIAICDVCKKECVCTEARDFGYLISDWKNHKD